MLHVVDTSDVIPGQQRARRERDEILMVAVHEVGQVLAKLAQAYKMLGDLGAIPGAAGLRAAAHSTERLAAEIQAVADDIEHRSPDRRQKRAQLP
jgi:hypothetical protein